MGKVIVKIKLTNHADLVVHELRPSKRKPCSTEPEALVDAMVAANTGRKKLLLFAAAKFMSQRELSRLGVDFCQLPYAIHRILGN